MPAKTHEDVERAFSPLLDYTVPVGSKVRIVLRTGLRIRYVHRDVYGHLINAIYSDESARSKNRRKKTV